MDTLSHLELEEFYKATLGKIVARRLKKSIKEIWPNEDLKSCQNSKNIKIAGYGYTLPIISAFKNYNHAEITNFVICSEYDGNSKNDKNIIFCAEEKRIKTDDQSVDVIIVFHGLEFASLPSAMLRECWRVLAPEGQIMVIVPHRASMWAHAEHTPFGHGRPYTIKQIKQSLRDNLFEPILIHTALSIPPAKHKKWIKFWHGFGFLYRPLKKILPTFGGALIATARKRVSAPIPVSVKEKKLEAQTEGVSNCDGG